MITTRIYIDEHLAEYCRSKFTEVGELGDYVRFPDRLDIYHLIYDLLERRPLNVGRDEGNLCIYLPSRRIGSVALGKNPETYNYLGVRSQKILNKKIKTMMRAELHDFIDDNKHKLGVDQIESVHLFMRKYGIESITEDALIKDYQRWRDSVRRTNRKRQYNRKK
ncbi:MAG: hypothetical protein Q3992_02155 [Bacteroides sp.]|nr:hypothetical protein [Bacteroides sp.]